MSKISSFLIFLVVNTFTNGEILSGSFSNDITVFQCPNPTTNTSSFIGKSTLPLYVNTPTRLTWCLKPGCGTASSPSYERSGQIIQTPYVQSINGFSSQLVWDFKKINYTDESKGREWTIFYNQDDCYSGGVEFGVLYWHQSGRFRFYCSIDSNLVTQKWMDKEISFTPVNGLNYLNLTVATNGTSFLVSLTSSIDNLNTLRTVRHVYAYPSWMQEFRHTKGRITGKINKRSDNDGMDSVKFNTIDYTVDTGFIPK